MEKPPESCNLFLIEDNKENNLYIWTKGLTFSEASFKEIFLSNLSERYKIVGKFSKRNFPTSELSPGEMFAHLIQCSKKSAAQIRVDLIEEKEDIGWKAFSEINFPRLVSSHHKFLVLNFDETVQFRLLSDVVRENESCVLDCVYGLLTLCDSYKDDDIDYEKLQMFLYKKMKSLINNEGQFEYKNEECSIELTRSFDSKNFLSLQISGNTLDEQIFRRHIVNSANMTLIDDSFIVRVNYLKRYMENCQSVIPFFDSSNYATDYEHFLFFKKYFKNIINSMMDCNQLNNFKKFEMISTNLDFSELKICPEYKIILNEDSYFLFSHKDSDHIILLFNITKDVIHKKKLLLQLLVKVFMGNGFDSYYDELILLNNVLSMSVERIEDKGDAYTLKNLLFELKLVFQDYIFKKFNFFLKSGHNNLDEEKLNKFDEQIYHFCKIKRGSILNSNGRMKRLIISFIEKNFTFTNNGDSSLKVIEVDDMEKFLDDEIFLSCLVDALKENKILFVIFNEFDSLWAGMNLIDLNKILSIRKKLMRIVLKAQEMPVYFLGIAEDAQIDNSLRSFFEPMEETSTLSLSDIKGIVRYCNLNEIKKLSLNNQKIDSSKGIQANLEKKSVMRFNQECDLTEWISQSKRYHMIIDMLANLCFLHNDSALLKLSGDDICDVFSEASFIEPR